MSAIEREPIAALSPEGDVAKKHLLYPTVQQLVGDVAIRKILDAGAGQGYFSRILANRGAIVTSVEPATTLIEHSRHLESQQPLGVDYVQSDLTTASFDPVFDAVLANMVFLSVHDWTRALDA